MAHPPRQSLLERLRSSTGVRLLPLLAVFGLVAFVVVVALPALFGGLYQTLFGSPIISYAFAIVGAVLGTLVVLGRMPQGTASRQMYASLRSKGWIGMGVLFGFALSIASFLTTMEGMLNFTRVVGVDGRGNSTAVGIAVLVSLGIQGVLFIISWIVAEDLAKRQRYRADNDMTKSKSRWRFWARQSPQDEQDDFGDVAVEARVSRSYWDRGIERQAVALPSYIVVGAPKLLMLGVAMFASVFFSFDSLFDRVFKETERKQVQIAHTRSVTSAAFTDMRDQLVELRGTQLVDLRGSDAWSDFTRNLEAVLTTAQNAEQEIAAILRTQREERQRELNLLRSQLTASIEAVRQKSDEITRLETGDVTQVAVDVDQLRSQIAEAQSAVNEAQTQVDRFTELANIEEKVGGVDANGNPILRDDGSRIPPGRGPRWRDYEAQRVFHNTALTARRATLERDQQRLAEAVAATGTRGSALEAARAQLVGLESERDIAQGRVDEAEAALRSVNIPGGDTDSLDLASIVNNIRLTRDRFLASGSSVEFTAMVEGCASMLAALELNAAQLPQIASLTCDASAISQPADRLSGYETALLSFDRDAYASVERAISNGELVNGRAVPEVRCFVDRDFNGLTSVSSIVGQGRECLNVAGLPADREASIRSDLDTVERENSPETSNFTRTLASLKRGDMLGWVALALAIAIDSLVFFSALAASFAASGARSDDDDHNSGGPLPPLDIDPRDPPGVVAQKLFLTYSRPFSTKGGENGILVDLNLVKSGAYRAKLRNLIMSLPQKHFRLPAKDIFHIRLAGRAQIVRELNSELRRLRIEFKDYGAHASAGANLNLRGHQGVDMDGVEEGYTTPEEYFTDVDFDFKVASQPSGSDQYARYEDGDADNVVPMPNSNTFGSPKIGPQNFTRS